MNPKISVLVAARKNSKYLAKFLHGLLANTSDIADIEVLVMLNEHDTWNKDLAENYTGFFSFYKEDMQLGRAGLHEYFNELYRHARGEWIIYFCEDHYINERNWDAALRAVFNGTAFAESAPGQPLQLQHHHGILDPLKVWVIIPKFDNAGPMNHILSRGFVEQLNGRLAEHGNLDSYLNDVIKWIPRERRIAMDIPLFHDFTHDKPSPMDDAHLQSVMSDKGKEMPKYDDPAVQDAIVRDANRLRTAIENGQ